MRIRFAVGIAAIVLLAPAVPATADDWKEEYRDGPCLVKREAKDGDYLKEIKCKEGIGATWHGEWKREFRDGPCLVEIDAKRDEYKEEVKCEPD
jgi:hypothetical protein